VIKFSSLFRQQKIVSKEKRKMATVRPFKGIRPRKDLAHNIAALPYDVYNREEACVEVEKEPLSFLKIDRGETNFSEDVSIYDDCVYAKAREILDEMIIQGEFVQDDQPCYYLYELTRHGSSQTGIVGCASIDDYDNNVIMKHENTRKEKEEDRIRHVDACDAQTGPIFLAYHENEVLQQVIRTKKMEMPVYDFVSEDGVCHRVWVIHEADLIQKVQKAFAGIQSIYIADGHHRCASAVHVGKKRRTENPGYTGEEEFNYFLSVLFQDSELRIMDYNRAVKDLNGLSEEEFLEKVKEKFYVDDKENESVRPRHKGQFGMYLGGKWYQLEIKENYKNSDPVTGLDVSLLQDHLLGPVLGIQDPKTDNRIDFIGGIRGLGELKKRVEADCKVAFSLYPTSIQELFDVADEKRLMPPKSTWFEPKLRSGLFIHRLS